MSEQVSKIQPIGPALLRRHARTAVEQHRHEQVITDARASATTDARNLGHHLGDFQPRDEGYEVAWCIRCFCGVAVNLETAFVSRSPGLERACEGPR